MANSQLKDKLKMEIALRELQEKIINDQEEIRENLQYLERLASQTSPLDSYLKGAAKALDLWSALAEYKKHIQDLGLWEDSLELASDWSSVGSDMAAALKKFREELDGRGSA